MFLYVDGQNSARATVRGPQGQNEAGRIETRGIGEAATSRYQRA